MSSVDCTRSGLNAAPLYLPRNRTGTLGKSDSFPPKLPASILFPPILGPNVYPLYKFFPPIGQQQIYRSPIGQREAHRRVFLSKVDRDEESRFTPFFIFSLLSFMGDCRDARGALFTAGIWQPPICPGGRAAAGRGGLKCHIIMNSRRPGWRRCALHGSGRLHTTPSSTRLPRRC